MASGLRLVAPSGGGDVAPEPRPVLASAGLWPWVELARRHELSIDELAKRVDLQVAVLRDPGARVPQAVANRVAELVIQRVGPAASVGATATVEAGHFALLELMARTAPNVGMALAKGCRFFRLIHTDLRLTHTVQLDGSHSMRITAPPYPVHPGYFELTFGVWLTAIRRETEREAILPVEVWFRHREPADRAPFEGLFGPGLHFGMVDDHLTIDASVAALRLVRTNAAVHADAVKAAADLLCGLDE